MHRLEKILWKTFAGGTEKLHTALAILLAEARTICGDNGISLIVELLDRFTYVTHDVYDQGIECMAEYVSTEFNLAQTLVCASTADHEKDSAQRVLYDVTTALGVLGFFKIHSCNRYDHVVKNYAGKIDDLVLVDEFLGTGRSMIGRAKTLKRVFRDAKVAIPRIHVLVLAGMDFGLRNVAPYVETINSCNVLRPGLKGFLKGCALSEAYKIIDLFEDNLAPAVWGSKLPRRGDGECEALYGRQKGNCPNSVLPIFWWPESAQGAKRKTAFSRIF